MSRKFAYWQHPKAFGHGLCRIEHLWLWTSRAHWGWRRFRLSIGVLISRLGLFIAGDEL